MKIKGLSIALALAVLLSACSELSEIFSPTKFYSPKAINTLVAELKKLSENYRIENVSVMEKNDFKGNFGIANVYMSDKDGNLYLQVLCFNMGIPNEKPIAERRTGVGGIPRAINIEDIANQADSIEKCVDAAKVQFTNEFGGNYKLEGIGPVQFRANKTGTLQIELSIYATEKGKYSIHQQGRRTVVSCYDFDFTVDKNGTVVYKE